MTHGIEWRVVEFPDGYRVLIEAHGLGTDKLIGISKSFLHQDQANDMLASQLREIIGAVMPGKSGQNPLGWDIEVDT